MSDVTIRDARSDDHPVWAELWQGYLTFYRHELPDGVSQASWEKLLSDDPSTFCLIAADGDDRPVGFAHLVLHFTTWATTPTCYLEDLFVDPALRGTGAGRKLIEAIYTRADAAGWSDVYWKTEENNYTARTLYDRVAAKENFLVYSRQAAAS